MNHSSARNTASLPSPLSTMFSNSVRARGRVRSALAGICFLLLLGGMTALAQTPPIVTFTDLQTTVPATGLLLPEGVAVDKAGDIFIADASKNQVVELPAGCNTASCQVTVASGLADPEDVAVDGAGDLYVVNNASGNVVEIQPNCTSACQTTVATNLDRPEAVAVDENGNVFIADTLHNQVVEVLEGCEGAVCQVSVGTGLNGPSGVAVDETGDVFIADQANGRVVEVPVNCTMASCQVTLASGLDSPTGVIVDGVGNVFVTYLGRTALEIPAGCSSPSCHMQVGTGLVNPQNLAVDQSGDVYIADEGNHRIVEVQTRSVNFGSVNVGSNSSLTLTFNIASDITLATTPSVVTQGLSGLDFTLDGAATCSGTQTAGSPCTVTVQFAPLAPGLRKGAVQLFDSSGNLQATVYIRGIGLAPVLAFTSGSQTTVGSGLSYVTGLDVDAKGNLFVAEESPSAQNQGQVLELPAGGGAPITINPPGLESTGGIAVDGAGNVLFAGNSGGQEQLLEAPAGGGTVVPVVPAAQANFSAAYPIVDGAGNIFFTDTANTNISEIPVGTAQASLITQLDFSPSGLAMDVSGGFFIADYLGFRIEHVAAGCTAASCETTATSAVQAPYSVALDAAGDLYSSENDGNDFALEFPFAGGPAIPLGTAKESTAIANDGTGNVFIGTISGVTEVSGSQASPLNFGTVLNGSTSAAQTVTIQNVGNQPLTFTSFTVSTNFQLDPSTTTCSTSSSLAKGATCNIGVICSPTTLSGALTGGLSIFDNTLNQPQGKQEVTLSCTASSQAPLITSVNSTMFPAGAADTFTITASGAPTPSLSLSGALPAGVSFIDNQNGTATLSGTPGASAGGTYNLTITASNGVSPNASQAFTLVVDQAPVITSGNSATFTPGTAGAFTVTASGSPTPALSESGALPSGVTFVDNHNGTATLSGTPAAGTSGSYSIVITASNGTSPNASQSFTLIVNQASQTISFTLPSSVQAQTTLTLTGTASSGLPVTYTSSTQSVCSVSGSTATFLTSGTCTIVASQAGNSGYNAATPVTASTMVTAAPQTITFTLPSSVQPQTMLTLMGTASSGLPVTYTSSTQSVCSVSGSTATFLTGGTCTIVASQAGNSTYAAATPVAASTKVGQTSQTITFNALPSSALQGSTVTLSATATSGLAVSFTSLTPAVCSVSGSSATLLKAGTCTIQASQPGNASYAPATPVSQSVVVTAAFTITPTPSIETIRRGNIAAFVLELKAASGFSGKVTLSCSGGPSGSYCADFPMTVSFQKGVALAVSGIYFPSSTPPGTYTLTFTGTSGSVSNTATAEFIVTQ